MEKIKSFTIDHMTLLPGVYESRLDFISPADAFQPAGNESQRRDNFEEKELYPVTTYDIRITRPNFEPVMGTGEIHTIEHLGATYLRNREDVKSRVLYWGPMGCRTGFYLIMSGHIPTKTIASLMVDVFEFVAAFEGDIPGATPVECGNYTDMDLSAAKARAVKYLDVLKTLAE